MPARPESTLLEVGRVDRSHGLRGEVIVHLVTNRLERLSPGSQLTARSPSGERRDLEVTAARPHGRRHIVRFASVSSREESDALHGYVLLAEAQPDGELFVHELIGSRVVDATGVERGSVTSVEANPASDLLVVDDKWYVPVRFVVRSESGTIFVEVPNGLFE